MLKKIGNKLKKDMNEFAEWTRKYAIPCYTFWTLLFLFYGVGFTMTHSYVAASYMFVIAVLDGYQVLKAIKEKRKKKSRN